MIVDTFIFFNELDLLEIRLNVLNDHVDRFVLVEATVTFQGKPKPLFFEHNKARFSKFLHKIVHVVVDDVPANVAPFDREYFQRDAILRGLDGCNATDLIIVSDTDEIPNPVAIPKSLPKGKVGLFRQSLFYYHLNTKCVELDFLPWSLAVNFDELGSPANLRKRVVAYHAALLSGTDPEPNFVLLENGGWHFSYLGSPAQIVAKIEAFSHDELNVNEFKDIQNIQSSIATGRDIFGRKLSFTSASQEDLPKYIIDNLSVYEEKGLLDPVWGARNMKPIATELLLPSTSSIIFDQYSRYKACSDLLLQTGFAAGDSVLDIGSGPECLFGQFMPNARMNYVDPLIPVGSGEGRITGNIFASELDGRTFDCVSAVDVLEHVPPEYRQAFLERVSALGRNTLILGFPTSDSSNALATDEAIDKEYRDIYGEDYSWLEEHYRYGLPSLAETVEQLTKMGWQCQSIGHGHAPWLKELLPFVISVWDIPSIKSLVLAISDKFNRELYPYDFRPPFYRQFVIASRRPISTVSAPQQGKDSVAADDAFKALMEEARRLYFAASLRQLVEYTSELHVPNQTTQSTPGEILQARSLAERDAAQADRDAAQAERDAALAELEAVRAVAERMRTSRSWRLTGPLRFYARVVRHGLVPEDRRKIVQKLRSVYRRAPMPEAVRGGLKRMYHWYAGRRRMAAQLQAKGIPFQLPSLRPAGRTEERPDYIVWGVIDWHFRHQRPQHLAQALAASGRRVFYISANLQADSRAGFAVESLDQTGQLFQIRLHLSADSSIYKNAPSAEALAQLRASTGELLEWADGRSIVSVVQHPFWHGVASVLPDSRMVYDCMDHHEGFGNNTAAILGLEQALLKDAFLTVATSDWLEKLIAEKARRCTVIRNAGEFAHFAQTPHRVFRDTEGRRVLGYVGAIAEWFDQDLVEALARRFSDCLIVLVGNDSVGARSRLTKYSNVKFVGEVPYGELPFYVHGFDVCLLPFKVIPLTLATNPVKVYEYLAAGKPVVAVDLPEMRQFGDMVEVGPTHKAFLDGAARALAAAQTAESVERRQEFARAQTWEHRARALIEQAEAPLDVPQASVIVVTYNNIELTKACLESLDKYSAYPALEVIVVDNASSDGSAEYLRQWVESGPNRQLILNNDNRGFAAANNLGLAAARGEYLVLLNNDTHVTPGWLGSLIGHLRRDQSIGLIGPVTNNIGNEAKIEIQYETMEQMIERSASFTRRHIGRNFYLRTAAFFCVGMSREVYEKVGPLDEAFGRGFFEDDDYCRRVEGLGLRVACAEDVFVHHHLSASFNKLKVADRQALFEQNKAIYEAKWGAWEPHAYRQRSGKSAGWEAPAAVAMPDAFIGQQYLNGKCTICGCSVRFFFADVALWRESLNCEHCLATSRYRSIARGILRAIRDVAGVDADSLASLPKSHSGRRIRIYDTQPPFYYSTCAYPLPDLLKATGWIDVELSQYKPRLKPGQRISQGVTNQNLECLTFADGSLDLVITSDVMEHVRLDKLAHAEIHRVLCMGGVYVFTVPHERSWPETLVRVQVTDPVDPAKDVHILEPEYHGDTNSGDGSGVLSYRVYGRDLDAYLQELGFDVQYFRDDLPELGILNTELYYCKKVRT